MKNLKFITLIILAGTMLFSSCEKDEETIAVPTIAFQNGIDVLEFDGTVGINTKVSIKAESKIVRFYYEVDSKVVNINKAIGETSFEYDFIIITDSLVIALEDKNELVYTFTLVDNENNSRVATYTVKENAVPTIVFQNGVDTLVFDGTNSIDVKVDITAEGKVANFKYTDGVTVTDISAAIGETTFSYDFMVSTTDLQVAMVGKKELVYTFTLVDKENNTIEATYTVTKPVVVAGEIETYTAKLMGAQANTTRGSFFATTTGMVYLTADEANTNSELIDIIYYFGTTNQATFCAPTDITVNGGTGNLDLATGLTTQNATKFVKADNILWAGVNDDALLVDITDINETKITSLAVDDILAFETAAGKKGILKVTAKTDGVSGSITIEVKVQK